MLNQISKTILLIIVTELCLGGGGRLTAIGPVSLRMMLFCVAIFLILLLLFKRATINLPHWKTLTAFALIISIGVVLGWINHSPKAAIWEDVKPLLYFLILPFFILTIDQKEIASISKIIKITSIALALLFFFALILIHSKALPFLTFYGITAKTQEFFYRGELSFFYKGFLFLGIGSLFFFFTGAEKKYLFVLLLIAIVLSVTRGLLVALAVTFVVYFFMEKKYVWIITTIAVGIGIAAFGNAGTIKLSQWIDSIKHGKSYEQSSTRLFGDRNYSDEGRITQIKEVGERVSATSIFIGHGFGQGITSRPIHMEIAYLEVFHKQGLIGLTFWGGIAWLIFIAYQKSNKSSVANSFFCASVFVFAESMTNQYFNNPIGMSVLLLSLVSLDKLRKTD